ncbi:TldD/PmbA family protein [Bacteroidales bacterium]|nr:TldD/PmbA family protein [Bacteroidales bacterium]
MDLNLAHKIIEKTKKLGAHEVFVQLTKAIKSSYDYRNCELENVLQSTENELRLDIYIDNKFSSNTTSNLNEATIDLFIKNSIEGTRFLAPDEFRSLPEPELYPKAIQDLKLYDSQIEALDIAAKKSMALKINEAAHSKDNKILSSVGSLNDYLFSTTKASSNGFSGTNKRSYITLNSEVTVKDGEFRPEGYYYNQCTRLIDCEPTEIIGSEAYHKAIQKCGQSKISSGKYPAVFEHSAMRRMLSMLMSAISGRAIQQKQSYLADMINTKIASDKLSIIDNPFVIHGHGSRNYDDRGIAAKKMTVVEKGILQNYYIDLYYGRKMNCAPTASSTSNLIFETGEKTKDEMIASVPEGILIRGILGGNNNTISGDFSFGVHGALIKNGEIVQPINEMNITGNAKEFWNQLVEIANDPYTHSAWKIPTMLFDSINFSGN